MTYLCKTRRAGTDPPGPKPTHSMDKENTSGTTRSGYPKWFRMSDHVPVYFRAKYQLIATVTFTAFFSLVFMLVSIPFTHNVWFSLGGGAAFAFTAAFYFISLITVIISKRVMYATRNLFDMTFAQYILWNLAEVFLICLLYTIFTIQGDAFGIIHVEDPSFAPIFLPALVYCFTSLVLPYIIAGMYFALLDKNNTIRLMDFKNVVSDEPTPPTQSEQKITLFDNNGVLKMSVNLSNLYYIESDDNYIIVWYTDSKGQLRRYLVRSRLKTVEESFRGSPLMRCHRKYIVNMQKVRLLRKEKDGYELELDNDAIPSLGVTKAYVEQILGALSSSV